MCKIIINIYYLAEAKLSFSETIMISLIHEQFGLACCIWGYRIPVWMIARCIRWKVPGSRSCVENAR